MNKIVEKALEILGVILLIPGVLIFLLLCLVYGADIDIERASDKELVAFSLLAYGLVFAFILLNALPSLYLPPNLVIVALFLGIGGPLILVGYIVVYAKLRKRKETWIKNWKLQKRRELEDQLKDLKEQLSRHVITRKEYEQKRKKLLKRSPELKEQLEYEQKKNKMLEDRRKAIVAWELKDQLKELDEQLRSGAITQEEYEQKKKLLEKSKA